MKTQLSVGMLLVTAIALSACGASQNDAEKKTVQRAFASDTVLVETVTLEKKTFFRHIVCNGRLEAVQRADIGFAANGTVTAVNVKEGDFVRSGQVLGKVDGSASSLSLRNARLSYDRSLAALEDRLLEYGETLADTAHMSAERKRSIFMSTGFSEAQLALESAEREYGNCVLKAPFAGKVANLQARCHEQAGAFCTLVDDSRFIVRFNILETEYPLVRPGLNTVVTSLNDNVSVNGTVRSVSPAVGQNGQIPVTSEIQGVPGLIDGMNVKITLESATQDRFVVPKSAVVIRDGQNVVFTYKDGTSHWVYVKIIDSNSKEHCIEADQKRDSRLSEGEQLIVSGNGTLADMTPVIRM